MRLSLARLFTRSCLTVVLSPEVAFLLWFLPLGRQPSHSRRRPGS